MKKSLTEQLEGEMQKLDYCGQLQVVDHALYLIASQARRKAKIKLALKSIAISLVLLGVILCFWMNL